MANKFSIHPDWHHQSSGKAIIRHLITLALLTAVLLLAYQALGAWKQWQLIG